MLVLKGVVYYYQNQKDKVILDHLSYSFKEGTVYAILGASGAGKTTLLSLMAGLDVPVSGTISVDGHRIDAKTLRQHRRQNVSLVFQNYNLIDYLTPAENVRLCGPGDPFMLLRSVGLTDDQSRRNVLQLSGGQQQRVAIARALASKAPVLLADEPTGNLDEKTAGEIVETFLDLAHNQNKCIILVTHSREVAKQADETLLLEHGILQRTEIVLT